MQKGGAFLVEEAGSSKIFIPEELSLEQKELAKTVHDFVVNEILPKEELIEEKMPGLMPKLLKRAAGLGIFAAEVPSEYGGLDLGKIDAAAIAEGSTLQGSFNVSYMAHTGIATIPLIYYGTKEQKEKYLPKMASGEMLGAFALTEPEAGSDVMSIRTTAKPTPDGKKYILNGQKQFITNGGFADIFTVFARLGDRGITAFLVEKSFGVKTGREERKMGIRGSSTIQLMFDDVKVPKENLLGEAGKGHYIAFNVLNVGRLKLGAACAGIARHLINLTYNYVKERRQFGMPILDFEMIQERLAMMAARTLLLESLVFRACGMFDEFMAEAKRSGKEGEALREYAIEASIAKVFGSEALFAVVDDAVQLHGGYGYCEEYGIERFFRDARINRIYEGTNEINRLVISGTVLKLAARGKIDVFAAMNGARERITELIARFDKSSRDSKVYAFIEILKRLILFIGAGAVQRYGKSIQTEQYFLSEFADLITELYAMESAYIRVKQLKDRGRQADGISQMTAVYLYFLERAVLVLEKGRLVTMHIMGEDSKEAADWNKMTAGIMSFVKGDRQKLTMAVIEKIGEREGYPF